METWRNEANVRVGCDCENRVVESEMVIRLFRVKFRVNGDWDKERQHILQVADGMTRCGGVKDYGSSSPAPHFSFVAEEEPLGWRQCP